MDPKMRDALNKQVNWEMYSSYLYLSMSSCLENAGFKGFAQWMKAQAWEELTHAMKIYDYIFAREEMVTLMQIDAPPTDWDPPLKIFEEVYGHERKVTGLINGLMDLALSLKDHATINMLQWFVKEQVEEEENALLILKKLQHAANDEGMVYTLDTELGQRAFKTPGDKK